PLRRDPLGLAGGCRPLRVAPIERRSASAKRGLASNPASQHTCEVKATFDLDPDLYRALKVEAARVDRSVREVVEEAVRDWLVRAEEAEDLASAASALEEYRRDGGVAAEAWFE